MLFGTAGDNGGHAFEGGFRLLGDGVCCGLAATAGAGTGAGGYPALGCEPDGRELRRGDPAGDEEEDPSSWLQLLG